MIEKEDRIRNLEEKLMQQQSEKDELRRSLQAELSKKEELQIKVLEYEHDKKKNIYKKPARCDNLSHQSNQQETGQHLQNPSFNMKKIKVNV